MIRKCHDDDYSVKICQLDNNTSVAEYNLFYSIPLKNNFTISALN